MGPPAIQWAPAELGAASGRWLLVFSPLSSPGLTAHVQCSDRQVGRLWPALGCLCCLGRVQVSQRSWSLVSVGPKALVRLSRLPHGSEEGPVPTRPLSSHRIGQQQSLVLVQVPAPSWLSLFPGSPPGCSTEALGEID